MSHLYEAMGLPSNHVYMRAIDKADLPKDVLADVEDATEVFAVYAEDGQQIALVTDQKMAFALAKEHSFNLQVVS